MTISTPSAADREQMRSKRLYHWPDHIIDAISSQVERNTFTDIPSDDITRVVCDDLDEIDQGLDATW